MSRFHYLAGNNVGAIRECDAALFNPLQVSRRIILRLGQGTRLEGDEAARGGVPRSRRWIPRVTIMLRFLRMVFEGGQEFPRSGDDAEGGRPSIL